MGLLSQLVLQQVGKMKLACLGLIGLFGGLEAGPAPDAQYPIFPITGSLFPVYGSQPIYTYPASHGSHPTYGHDPKLSPPTLGKKMDFTEYTCPLIAQNAFNDYDSVEDFER